MKGTREQQGISFLGSDWNPHAVTAFIVLIIGIVAQLIFRISYAETDLVAILVYLLIIGPIILIVHSAAIIVAAIALLQNAAPGERGRRLALSSLVAGTAALVYFLHVVYAIPY